MTPTRRDVLLAGAAASLLGCPRPTTPDSKPSIDPQGFDHATRVTFSPQAVPEPLELFPQAVASGATVADAALVWTRSPSLPRLLLKVWRDVGSDTEIALVLDLALEVPSHGAVKASVNALAPATVYRFAFFNEALTARSPIGTFKTAFPEDWAEPVTFGTTSCAKLANGPFVALALQAEQPLDFVVHVGDLSYNDEATSLEQYRAKWRATFSDPGYRALLPSCGLYATWDDHDFWNNFDPEAVGADDSRFLNAKTAFLESVPVALSPDGHLWRSYRWGKTVELFVLDSRTERKESTRLSPHAQYLSRAQMDWLKAGLLASPCHFKFIVSSVPITTMPPPLWGGSADRWEGYPSARTELLDHLTTNGLTNVWFLGGDFHLGLVMRIDVSSPYLEITGGPAGNANPLSVLLAPGQDESREIAFPKKQFLFATGGVNATTLTLDPKADTVRVVFQNGTTREVTFDRTLTFGS
jgi:alkaline phosphatase D